MVATILQPVSGIIEVNELPYILKIIAILDSNLNTDARFKLNGQVIGIDTSAITVNIAGTPEYRYTLNYPIPTQGNQELVVEDFDAKLPDVVKSSASVNFELKYNAPTLAIAQVDNLVTATITNRPATGSFVRFTLNGKVLKEDKSSPINLTIAESGTLVSELIKAGNILATVTSEVTFVPPVVPVPTMTLTQSKNLVKATITNHPTGAFVRFTQNGQVLKEDTTSPFNVTALSGELTTELVLGAQVLLSEVLTVTSPTPTPTPTPSIGEKGEKGEKGDKGDIGLTGLTGATGAQGIQGIPGATGATGTTGATGAIGIGLDEADSFVGDAYLRARSTCSADNAHSHCIVKTQGIADRDRPLSRYNIVRAAQSHLGQVLGINLHNSDIRQQIDPLHLTLKLSAVFESHFHSIRPGHNVSISNYAAVRSENKPRTCTPLNFFFGYRQIVPKKPAKQRIFESFRHLRSHLGGSVNPHHAGPDFFRCFGNKIRIAAIDCAIGRHLRRHIEGDLLAHHGQNRPSFQTVWALEVAIAQAS
jgi:Collagen triple helix repeat (20 copies).